MADTPTEWQADMAGLRAEIAVLRASIATEVRPRRLVVVDEHGAERITTFINENYAEISVEWPLEESREGVTVALVADNDGHAGLNVTVCGNIAASVMGSDELDLAAKPQERRGTAEITLHDERHYRYIGDDGWKESPSKPYLQVDPEQGLTLRANAQDIRGRAVIQVPMA